MTEYVQNMPLQVDTIQISLAVSKDGIISKFRPANCISIKPPLKRPEVLSSASDNQNRLLKTFLRTIVFMTQVSLYLFSLLELI